MNPHTLPNSVLSLVKVLAPLMHGAANSVPAAAEPLARNARAPGHAVTAALPISCISSGRVKARDVEAARRYYVDSQ